MKRNLRKKWEDVIEATIKFAGVASIIFVILILVFLLKDALPILRTATLGDLICGQEWRPTSTPAKFGFLPLILGSFLVTVVALVIAIPLGVACAAFLSEVAPSSVREVVKPIVEILAAIPSVVFGFVGLMLLGSWVKDGANAVADAVPGPEWLQSALSMPTGMAAITGAIMLAIMTLPTIVSISEDALNAVPRSYRMGSWALGATRWQTIVTVTVPAARSGIIAAIMLGIGRVVGETMTVLMVTGNSPVMPKLTNGLFRPVRTMTATIAAEMGETAHQTEHYHALFMLGVLLFLITFAVNTAADYVTNSNKHVETR
ncbi:MAG: phosphate ABC transporter permease subunit PstC [Acidobacteriota bacterium]|nr:phosphate ABC transporter permease subunit PstC [Acidobacteriota bacterium]